jgi:hypothetical protein
MMDIKLGRKCNNIGCTRNTGILNFGKMHYQELTDAEMRCELLEPRRVEDSDGTWYCEDEVRYEDMGGV